jgi:HEAT repeat protein
MIESGRLARTAPKLLALLAEPDRPTAERVAVVKALGALGDKVAVMTVKALASRGAEDALVRVEALRSLALLEPAASQESAKILLADKDADVQQEAVAVLGSQPVGAKLLAEQLLAKKIPRTHQPAVLEALRRHAAKEPELQKLLAEVMKLPKE